MPSLRPHPLTPGEISLILKHKIAHRRIVEGGFDFGIIAEDDLLISPQSEAYLREILRLLPPDFDYVDVAV